MPKSQLDYSEFGTYSPDDYFDDATEDLREDSFEEKFDKMNKDSKSKEKSNQAKQAKLDRIADAAANGGPPGLAKKANDGITDNDPTKTSGTVSVEYVVADFTAIKNGKNEATDKIRINVVGPSGTVVNNEKQGDTDANFTPTEPGTFTITASDNPLTAITRTVVVGASGSSTIVVDVSNNSATISKGVLTTLNGTGSTVGLTHSWALFSISNGNCNGSCIIADIGGSPDYQGRFTPLTSGPANVVYMFDLTITNSTSGDDETSRLTITAN